VDILLSFAWCRNSQTANPQAFSGLTAQPHQRDWAMKKHAGFMPL
jgi:hypothetical protein